MHVAINDYELPPKSLRSINPLYNGIALVRGQTSVFADCQIIRSILEKLSNGDIVSYHLRAGNSNKLSNGKARIIALGWAECQEVEAKQVIAYTFELEPIERQK